MDFEKYWLLITTKMLNLYKNDSKRIQHFLKVYTITKLICQMEEVDEKTLWICCCSALVHDIGIKEATKKHGYCNGYLQQLYGPNEAMKLLSECNLDRESIERICFLVGHHHTYNDIKQLDYQILVEADFLVNFYEEGLKPYNRDYCVNKIFKTKSGLKLYDLMYKP